MATFAWTWWFPQQPAQLWPELSDTDRFNRRAGLPAATYLYEPMAAGGSRSIATIAVGPVRIHWVEPPWDWVENEFYRVDRQYLGGPLRRFSTTLELVPERDGTRVDMTVELVARNLLGRLLVPSIGRFGKIGANRAVAAAAAACAVTPAAASLAAVAAQAPNGGATSPPLARARALLLERGFEPWLVERFITYLATTDDRELAAMRPFALADEWRADRMSLLRLFLAATRGGVLNLRWSVLCPSCRAGQGGVERLSALAGAVHCDACNLSFGPQFDRSVEVTFNAGPLGKGVDVPVFCKAGPHNTPHIVAQRTLAPRARAALQLDLERGHYLAEAVGLASVTFACGGDEGSSQLAARITDGEIEGVPESLAGSALALDLESAASREAAFRLVKTDWPDTITTAAQVTALQDFRDLFSSEVLSTGLELAIQSLTVLFTDLVGSTELYATTGDAPAFRIVHEHFAELRAIIAAHDGAIVKTIGDAVMAVFADPGKAFAAAVCLPPAVGKVRTERGPLMLRVGLHGGPCIAMQANDKLDYFGTTVNLAARIQHAAGAGEVLLSASSAEQPAIAQQLRGLPRPPVRESLAFKGFSSEVAVVRVSVMTP